MICLKSWLSFIHRFPSLLVPKKYFNREYQNPSLGLNLAKNVIFSHNLRYFPVLLSLNSQNCEYQ